MRERQGKRTLKTQEIFINLKSFLDEVGREKSGGTGFFSFHFTEMDLVSSFGREGSFYRIFVLLLLSLLFWPCVVQKKGA